MTLRADRRTETPVVAIRRPRGGERTTTSLGRVVWWMFATECLLLVGSSLASQAIRFGTAPNGVALGPAGVDYTTFSIVLSALWAGLILVQRAGSGPDTFFARGAGAYRDLTHSTLVVFVVVAAYSGVAQAEISRGYLLAAIPLGLTVLALDRACWVTWVDRQRRRGRFLLRTVVVGPQEATAAAAALIAKDARSGLDVVGRVAVEAPGPGRSRGVSSDAVSRTVTDVCVDLLAHDPDAVVIAGASARGEDFVRELSWAIEGEDVLLVVAPQVGPISSKRLGTVPVAGHQLIRVEAPRYSGARFLVKRTFDVVGSACGLVVLSPLLVAVAVAVRLDSPGPALFRQTRVGQAGSTFTMRKFRTMVVDAADRADELAAQNEHAGGPLFKMKVDPRVTRLGRHLRRYSIDELPQLVDVLLGNMSLVGPRPPLPTEVEAYDGHASRRLLSKPGLTGPWQVNGRSDLDWEEGLYLDLLYVENWSLVEDFTILLRTFGAVVRARGAY